MAVEPRMRDRWERQFAGYVQHGFDVTISPIGAQTRSS
jgi:subfamily B ATP-binding cassette protein HlyB/CyaB